MNDAKFDYGMSALSALRSSADVEMKKSASPEKKQIPKKTELPSELPVKHNDFTDNSPPDSLSNPDNNEVFDEKELKRNRIKSLIKLAVIGASITIVIIITTIAWFSMNKETGASGMSLKVAGAPFELEVRGDNIENSADFSKADATYHNGVVQTGLTPTTYRTSGADNYEKIIWRKTGSLSANEGLEPDSHGALTFWVVPNETGTMNIEFTFNIRGFIGTYTPAANENDEPTLDDLFEVTDTMTVTAENGLKDADDLAKKQSALEFVKGHILFFADYDITNNYFSGFLGTGKSIRFGDCINPASNPKAKYNANSPVSVTAGQAYQITIYWKWANTFEQMVLDENSPYKDNPLFPASNTTDRALMYTYLGDTTHNKVFSGLADVSTPLGIVQSGTNINSSLTALTNAYDGADQLIGNNLDYILIEMNAEIVS